MISISDFMKKKYLALGDSYTIGEQVENNQNFPVQTKQILNDYYNIQIADPHIIAKTGWKTSDLIEAINEKKPTNDFSLVSLLIGVNNQYNKLDINQYKLDFKYLLDLAISFVGGEPKRVFVLSIPDWGQTPFAMRSDKMMIRYGINAYNKINESLAEEAGCNYLNITADTRLHATDLQYLAPDLLHYSKVEYQEWAQKLCKLIAESEILN